MALLHDSEFWILVALVIAIGVAWRPLSKTITTMLDTRTALIRDELEEAKRLREEAELKLAEFQRKQRDALHDAEEIIARAKADAELIGKQAEADLEESLKRREQQAQQRIEQSQAQALAEVRSAVVDVAIEATRRLVRDGLSADRGAVLIDRAIEDLSQSLH